MDEMLRLGHHSEITSVFLDFHRACPHLGSQLASYRRGQHSQQPNPAGLSGGLLGSLLHRCCRTNRCGRVLKVTLNRRSAETESHRGWSRPRGDAVEIRRRVFAAFERAEREADAAARQQLMTFVIVGGGPTGVELALAIGELAHHTLRSDFRTIDTTQTKILLLESTDRILPTFSDRLSHKADVSLKRLGVTVCTNTPVTDIRADVVEIRKNGKSEPILTKTVLWSAGVQASPLGKPLAQAAAAEIDRQGRVIVEPDLTVPSHPEILVLGDLAHFRHQDRPLPGVAPVAMQQGRYAVRLIRRRLRGKATSPFRCKNRGNMAVIGRSAAVAQVGRLQLHGWPAWAAWLFVHLINLVEFENRLLVLLQRSSNA